LKIAGKVLESYFGDNRTNCCQIKDYLAAVSIIDRRCQSTRIDPTAELVIVGDLRQVRKQIGSISGLSVSGEQKRKLGARFGACLR